MLRCTLRRASRSALAEPELAGGQTTLRAMSAAEQQAAALQQMRNEVQAQGQRDLMTKMTEKCFAKCAANAKGGNRLERGEQMCVGMCVDRYVDVMNCVNEALVARQRDRS